MTDRAGVVREAQPMKDVRAPGLRPALALVRVGLGAALGRAPDRLERVLGQQLRAELEHLLASASAASAHTPGEIPRLFGVGPATPVVLCAI